MKLKVPLIQQREGSYHCQVATTLMILEFLQDSMSYDELLSALDPYLLDDGMHSQGPALFFRKRGYETFFAHHDLGMLDSSIENCTEKDVAKLEERLASLERNEKNVYQIEKLTLDIEFIKNGGHYSSSLPKLTMIDDYLDKGLPVVLSGVRNKGLHLNPTAGNGNHSIVIVGKEDDIYFVNDPSPKTDSEYSIHRDRLLHAWYNSGAQMRVVWK
ncbi:MAG: hypothetical protein COU10_02400 [Candidatus Harrisonbacteria bacterium CG10_big_fil_rev_8_21_14_0_10_45_28]|uniref:Uncharacterized protein n=1 Tax=Candidatus Harrisonbacteria bacterium CG10_big_fil_rev_8_21_14_0_10_45_28 TaxID=1974586 RepID=A0A2H0UN54_9BACT|nr:MAG: hypothetical protein COU10_02400 [Candidatus Harrisonbacteria bacterium CG10_big_fil_rev_8_21_14_0_10_45_28]